MDERQPKNQMNAQNAQISGVAVVGDRANVRVVNNVGPAPTVTPADLEAVKQLLAELRARIEQEAPAGQKDHALMKVDELQEAIAEGQPTAESATSVQSVKDWFVKHAPGLLGAVTSVLVHPVVGKVVEAAGEAVSEKIRQVIKSGV